MGKNQAKRIKKGLRSVWRFIWEDNSIWSWIVNVILAFVIIKFLVYPAMGFMLGTTHPVVAVVSSSMEHNPAPICIKYSDGKCTSYKEEAYSVCGFEVDEKKFLNFDEYYGICGEWYLENTNITKEKFREFSFRNGFNKGDIMVLGNAENARIGDIIVFYAENRPDPIIHRLVKITEDGYTTKGDHNHDSAGFEENIKKESVIGKAVVRIPLLGWIKIGFIGLLRLFAGG